MQKQLGRFQLYVRLGLVIMCSWRAGEAAMVEGQFGG